MDNTKEAINSRFIEAINQILSTKKESTKTSIAEKLKIKKANFSEILNKRMSVSAKLIADLCILYNDFNSDWILTGRNEMIAKPNKNDFEAIIIQDELPNYGLKKTSENNLKKALIPIYDINISGGLKSLLNNPKSYTPVDHIMLPNIGMVDGAIQVSGDNMMYPLIKTGDIVIFKKITDITNNIFWGEMYLLSYDLEGEECVVIRYIQKSNINKHIQLTGQKSNHTPIDISVSKIKALAQVKACLQLNPARLTE